MTVKELKDLLQHYDDAMPVYVENEDGFYIGAVSIIAEFDAGLDIALIKMKE